MTSDKKYQVFVSSTYADLQDARQELMMALLSMGMIPTGMELYPSEQNNQWPMIQKVINECDYYVVLVGGRYGSLSPIGLSYTHREYVYAATKKKPVIAFLHDHPELLPQDCRETSREGDVRFRDFRKLVQEKAAIFRHWSSPADLAEVVRKSMPLLIRQNPAPGWVRAGQVADLSQVREVQDLKKRIEDLEREKNELTAGWRPPLETLARGSDNVTLQYSCNAYIKGDCKVTMADSKMTWDQVFAAVGPQMMNEVPEAVMREALEEAIAARALSDVQQVLPKAHAVRNVVLSTASFNQVKIQLRALGLIRKNPAREASGQIWWQLTPHGDHTMTQVLSQIRG
ncbi:MAG: DUF4062 domain-containing protein [Alcanivoracaceae bacterium]|nr:DUF4062 domain-containing protein [Alcanivoracaceae bacterium]